MSESEEGSIDTTHLAKANSMRVESRVERLVNLLQIARVGLRTMLTDLMVVMIAQASVMVLFIRASSRVYGLPSRFVISGGNDQKLHIEKLNIGFHYC